MFDKKNEKYYAKRVNHYYVKKMKKIRKRCSLESRRILGLRIVAQLLLLASILICILSLPIKAETIMLSTLFMASEGVCDVIKLIKSFRSGYESKKFWEINLTIIIIFMILVGLAEVHILFLVILGIYSFFAPIIGFFKYLSYIKKI